MGVCSKLSQQDRQYSSSQDEGCIKYPNKKEIFPSDDLGKIIVLLIMPDNLSHLDRILEDISNSKHRFQY